MKSYLRTVRRHHLFEISNSAPRLTVRFQIRLTGAPIKIFYFAIPEKMNSVEKKSLHLGHIQSSQEKQKNPRY